MSTRARAVLGPLMVLPLFVLVVLAGTMASTAEGRTMFVLGILVVVVLVVGSDVIEGRGELRAVVALARREGLIRQAAALAVFVALLVSLFAVTLVAGAVITGGS